MKALKNEQEFEEEKLRLEQELRQTLTQITDIINLNSDVTIENKKKDALLVQKETMLSTLREKNISETQQLEAEFTCLCETTDFDLKIRTERIAQLQLKHER